MSRPRSPRVTIALPVYNGADTLAPVIRSVLEQSHSDIELLISDNASTDATEEISRHFAGTDERVVYHRHPTNLGLLTNFISAAERATGTYVRWIGDDDWLEPDYVERVLDVFAADERRVLVTTQIVYVDADGAETLDAGYDPVRLACADPLERFGEMLRLLTSGYALLDPLYATMRREVAVLPRRNMLREDEIFACRLALAGPWGHVPAALARRHRSQVQKADLVRLLGVPGWHRHAMDLLMSRELWGWIDRSALDVAQRRRARAEVVRMYARRKRATVQRGVAKVERMAGRPIRLSPSGAP
jgi:glycosyltransferase involved in cell wall biosynthesis